MDSMAGEEQYTTQITSPRLQQETVAEEERSGWIVWLDTKSGGRHRREGRRPAVARQNLSLHCLRCLRRVADSGPVSEEFSRHVIDVVFEQVALILRQRHFFC